LDEGGSLMGPWGRKGQGYEWPEANDGITVNYEGCVLIGGNARGTPPGAARGGAGRGAAPDESQTAGTLGYFHDSIIMKFTQDGKFVMQIGKVAASKGSNDVENLRLPAKIFVDKNTNEVYVADGYG